MDIVVDTLNICHFIFNEVNETNIIKTITEVSVKWKRKKETRIMFVLKDSTMLPISSTFEYLLFEECKKQRVYCYIAMLARDIKHSYSHHASLGRDDYICAFLAKKYKCSVLSNDKFRDFRDLKYHVESFYLHSYSYASDKVIIDFINPKHIRLHRPTVVPYHL